MEAGESRVVFSTTGVPLGRAAALPRYEPYFSALRAGEHAWRWPDRDKFWHQWDRRGDARPEGAFAH